MPPSVQLETPVLRPRFLSEPDCRDIIQRLKHFASGGGYTAVTIMSKWLGYVRWSRNQITLAGEVCTPHIEVVRNLNGGSSHWVLVNETTDEALVAAARRAERLAALEQERPMASLISHFAPESVLAPKLFSETTYQLDAAQRSAAARQLITPASQAGMLSAGYLEISAHSQAVLTSWGYQAYFQYTWAQLGVTVRDPKGVGSGWAGMDHHDWGKIDAPSLGALALDKCLKSRNPVAVEPGRYQTILEPSAVAQFVGAFFGCQQIGDGGLRRDEAEWDRGHRFNRSLGNSRLGEQVIDTRLSIGADPMDPELGFPPQDPRNWWADQSDNVGATVYRPVTWVQDGVLINLSYNRRYALDQLRKDEGLRNEGALRMRVNGPTTSVEEMVATTKRGLLVNRFFDVEPRSAGSSLCTGWTRDGVWLIEDGKISKPVKNFMFEEDVLASLNRVEHIGTPRRVLMPSNWNDYFTMPTPRIMPTLTIRDFNFVALSDAV